MFNNLLFKKIREVHFQAVHLKIINFKSDSQPKNHERYCLNYPFIKLPLNL